MEYLHDRCLRLGARALAARQDWHRRARSFQCTPPCLTWPRPGWQGFKGMSAPRLAVEIPLADEGPQAAAKLAAELLAGLPAEAAGDFTLVFADVEAALSARPCPLGRPCMPTSCAALVGVCTRGICNWHEPGPDHFVTMCCPISAPPVSVVCTCSMHQILQKKHTSGLHISLMRMLAMNI